MLRYGRTAALAGASAAVASGEIVAMVGPSGSGKTTMLYCMSGLLRPDSGSVFLDDREVSSLSDDERSKLRREMFGFVFQFAELVPELTLRENVALPLQLLRRPRREVRQRVGELLERLDLLAHAERRPAQVSGGQAQRAAVARAIAHRPSVVYADEPTGSLDSENGKLVVESLVDLARQHGTAVVLVTHDPGIASCADRTIRMADGKHVEPANGNPSTLLPSGQKEPAER